MGTLVSHIPNFSPFSQCLELNTMVRNKNYGVKREMSFIPEVVFPVHRVYYMDLSASSIFIMICFTIPAGSNIHGFALGISGRFSFPIEFKNAPRAGGIDDLDHGIFLVNDELNGRLFHIALFKSSTDLCTPTMGGRL